jgi:hypothetical protein
MTALTDKLKADVAGARERDDELRNQLSADQYTNIFESDKERSVLLATLDTALAVIEVLEAEHELVRHPGRASDYDKLDAAYMKTEAAITAALGDKG